MVGSNIVKAPADAKTVLEKAGSLFSLGRYAEAAILYQKLLQTN